ncbi:hypothetical protein GGR55DRAFT_175773 [Xylaria sp. FL0064]|nr:hypothetical protein GGR55DRAFT_175773 [Xylaria sp. FL0064]
MQWDFPGRSARIDLKTFDEDSFQQSLASFLEQASMESLYFLQASTKKAGISVEEVRDTTNPALITQMLMSLLEAIGSHYKAPVLRKRIRDDVNLSNGNIPWRRLPFWLIVRLAAQRQLCFSLGAERGQIAYKYLIAMILARVLDDSAGLLRPEQVVCLRTKLARRMAKLEMLQNEVQIHKDVACHDWCVAASAIVRHSIQSANMKIEAEWDSFKRKTARRIPALPDRAPPDSIKLTLPNSGKYLEGILSETLIRESALGPETLSSPLDKRVEQSQQLTDCAFDLAALEAQIEREADESPNLSQSPKDRCLELETQIKSVLSQMEKVSKTVGSAYDSSPEQNSSAILAIFTLWVKLDKSAIEKCPLLADHAPVFQPELLDVLQLPTKWAMERLQKIQEYLADRHDTSVFSSVLDNSVALRYVAKSKRLRSLRQHIQSCSDHARLQKENEHRDLCGQYDRRTQSMMDFSCVCERLPTGERSVKGCTRCWHKRVRNRLSIGIHEAFLPEKNPERDTILFELGIPEWLSAYRDVTWKILSGLAHPHKPNPTKPEIHLHNCQPLRGFTKVGANRISLASRIKCFVQTHYKFKGMKVPLEDVVLPFAAMFTLYDSQSKIFVRDLSKPLTLEHLCGIQISRSLLALLPNEAHPPTIVNGPSSYEIQANQTLVPKDVPIQAFSSHQKLLAQGRRRWPTLLVELSSSNLKLGDEDTMRLICQLASQAGPRLPDEPLRAVHEIFRIELFTTRLTATLENMLESIKENWREHNIMQLVVALALRLNCLSGQSLGIKILATARRFLLGWISKLRKKVRGAKNSAEAQQYATYGLYAALICRATFGVLGSEDSLSQQDLSEWLQASMALQENALHDHGNLSDILRELVFRDAKMVYRLQKQIKSAIKLYHSTVGIALRDGFPDMTDDETACLSWKFLPEPEDRWIVTVTPGGFPKRIHFNYIEGHLLVNRKLQSKLPLEIADDDSVKLIFGNQYLLTWPSSLPGMSHLLVQTQEGHMVHFGMRKNHAIIRAVRHNETWEFIPQRKLVKSGSFDLPAELVQNCGHWLNLTTKRLEIRRSSPQMPTFWVTRPRDWILDVTSRSAIRGGSHLVDPQSEIFSQITEIFSDFEQPDRLTVFQPQNAAGRLTVELKHMDLHFSVNRNQLLYCQQLNAEIDRNQDAGVWYGLRSKIVMREIGTRARSIIVPLGVPIARRNRFHVDVCIQGASDYAKFKIDTLLGRLSCNPEPLLIYTQALYHAITSFCLPDSLTGRTGSSEAFAILQSGTAQPWEPLTEKENQILEAFSKLIPRREYYPPEIKRIQKVTWNSDLTSWIQCDGYRPAIEAIKERSNKLAAFSTKSVFRTRETSHLCRRGRAQRHTYDPLLDVETRLPDTEYTPRDRTGAANVHRIARVILSRCSQFQMRASLISILESSEVIGGFPAADTRASISPVRPLINQVEDSIIQNWGELVDICRGRGSQSSLLFRLGLLAFNGNANMDLIHCLAAFNLVDEINSLNPPQYQYFTNFQSRGPPSVELIESLVSEIYPKSRAMDDPLLRFRLVTQRHAAPEHDERCKKEGMELAERIYQRWPGSAADVAKELMKPALEEPHGEPDNKLIDINSAWEKVEPEWQRQLANMELSNYAERVDEVLRSLSLRSVRDIAVLEPWVATEPVFTVAQCSLSYRSIVQDWTTKPGPAVLVLENSLLHIIEQDQNTKIPYTTPDRLNELSELGRVLEGFEQSDNSLRRQYGLDLLRSLSALEKVGQELDQEKMASFTSFEVTRDTIDRLQIQAKRDLKDIWYKIAAAFTAHDDRDFWLELGAMRPLSTTTDILRLLRSTESWHFGPRMKEAIVSYGIAITKVQHLTRIHRALMQRNRSAFCNELCYVGHETWKPTKVPDWLLLEIDSDILIRPEQVAVARAIIDPTLGNGVLQLSMGKGKTSCIIPMVEAVLADGTSLSRVIVPKALLTQTAQIMQSKLGGLVGRDVIHLPYSRRTSTTKQNLDLYIKLHHEAQQTHRIMLTCAEHLLSYKLLGWQNFVDSHHTTADQMICFQDWLDAHCRDVLDECDFTLSVKTQLNYPSGPEMLIDFHPYRWQIAQELLDLVDSHLQELQRQHGKGIQVTLSREKEYFPRIQFLRTDTENFLHELIVEDICSGGLTFLRPAHPQYQREQGAIREVLCGTRISDELLNHAASLFLNPKIARSALLLVRGLLLHRIIVLCLNKRWNVQYGLHPDRDPIAVPFEAKGKPSEQAEYSHPDVSILFTCLSFYYAGLTRDQLTQGLQHILQSNDPAAQYEWWTSTCSKLPQSLRVWNMINADDKSQMEKLWRFLRWNRIAINHYLNHFVFPIHARQFKIKLQACAWDIPIYSRGNTQLTRTTGFSGTNDNRMVLPLTISQRDLPELQHTSAEVLSYLLQKRNREFHTIANDYGQRLTEKAFLRDLKAKGVSVLIDAGAYISEMGNEEVARTWLEVDTEAEAVVYFRNDNRAWVHYRSNAKEDAALLATPLAENLKGCNVFLDEGHTRGVDLRLPPTAHGAVTLALKLTKDHAVQAAMRLRQLKTTQRICFYGPPEVEQSIRDFRQLNPSDRIDSSHVVSWLLEQTCRSIEDLQALYIAQGVDYCQRTDAIWQCKGSKQMPARQRLLEVLKQPERKTLNELYGSSSERSDLTPENDVASLQLRSFMDRLILTSKYQKGRIKADALEEVEQEREVEAQVEEVRQVQKRKRYVALQFPGMHPDILHFAQTGILKASQPGESGKRGYEHAFAFVGKTKIGEAFGVHETSSRFFVSSEFANTVEVAPDSHEGDNFLRPVEWIAWSPKTETALVVIPEEAEYLLGFLRDQQDETHIHLIVYAAPVTKAMVHFNRLDFYSYPELPAGHSIPERIRIELGILAGRLYVDRDEWKTMAEYVKGTGSDLEQITADPAAFLLEWLSIRCKTVNILYTPMGYICTGRKMEIVELSEDMSETE